MSKMPTLDCPGGSAPLSGADRTIFAANTSNGALAGALAQIQSDADRDADFAATRFTCIPKKPCRACQRHVKRPAVVVTAQDVTHWSLINIFSRILGGNADFTAKVDFTWTSQVDCDCSDPG
jgi:hypothetical protein